jgi:lipoprotein-releasing system ATP-binding protein
MEILLSAKNISKTFQGRRVLDNIDIEINNAEIVAISGPSGAGKTTLLNILSTLDKPDESNKSSLIIDNEEIFSLGKNGLANLRNQKIGFVFQFHELIPELSVLENVCLPGWIKKDNDVKKKAEELLKYFGLEAFTNKKPLTLSGGERQRVAIARSLVNNPKIIFADEPTGNLDSKNADLLHEIFLNLRKKHNQTFIIVTHNSKLASMSDRVLNLKDGMLIN